MRAVGGTGIEQKGESTDGHDNSVATVGEGGCKGDK